MNYVRLRLTQFPRVKFNHLVLKKYCSSSSDQNVRSHLCNLTKQVPDIFFYAIYK